MKIAKAPVRIDVFPDKDNPGKWCLEVGFVDKELCTEFGNPLVFEDGFDSALEATLNGQLFAASEECPVALLKTWEGST